MLKFEVSSDNFDRIQKWLREEVYPLMIAKQKEDIKEPTEYMKNCWDHGVPWEGASRGGLDYIFSPTSLGVVFRAKYGKYVLDLTDYGEW